MKKQNPSLNIHPETLPFVNTNSDWYDWQLKVKTIPFDLMLDHHQPKPEGDTIGFRCGVCFSNNIQRWDAWGTGSAAGVYEYREFKCLDCKNHSLFERETG